MTIPGAPVLSKMVDKAIAASKAAIAKTKQSQTLNRTTEKPAANTNTRTMAMSIPHK